MKYPLVAAVIIFCLGIFAASIVEVNFLPVYLLSLIFFICSILSCKRKLSFDIFLSCFIFFLGASLFKNAQILPKCDVSHFIAYSKTRIYKIKGFIDSQPGLKNNKLSFEFKPQKVQFDGVEFDCCGRILVNARPGKDLRYADELILAGGLYRVLVSANSTRAKYARYLNNQGIHSVMQAKIILPTGKDSGLLLKRFAFWIKHRMERIIFQSVSPIAAGILDAMILGEKSGVPVLIYNSMMKSGTVHILVVSGFNVGIVSFIIALLLKIMRIPRKARFFGISALLILYCLITGGTNPVVRATVMAIVFMFAYFIKKEADIYNSCALAALFILGFNPLQLFDIGFQLSFASVSAIIFIYPKINIILRLETLQPYLLKFLAQGLLVSFSAWAGTVVFIACYFKIFSPVTVAANIFIVPIASLITLCGFSLIAINLLFPPLVPSFAASCEFLVKLLLGINGFLVKLPGAYFYLS